MIRGLVLLYRFIYDWNAFVCQQSITQLFVVEKTQLTLPFAQNILKL
jgi:hypothetical protein